MHYMHDLEDLGELEELDAARSKRRFKTRKDPFDYCEEFTQRYQQGCCQRSVEENI